MSSALEQERKSRIAPIRKVSNGFIGRLHPMRRLVRWNSSKPRWTSPGELLSLGSLCRRMEEDALLGMFLLAKRRYLM